MVLQQSDKFHESTGQRFTNAHSNLPAKQAVLSHPSVYLIIKFVRKFSVIFTNKPSRMFEDHKTGLPSRFSWFGFRS